MLHILHDIEGNRLAEYLYDSATQSSTLVAEYIWMDGTLVGVVTGGVLYFVYSDHIGRPVLATDANDNLVYQALRSPHKPLAPRAPRPNAQLRRPPPAPDPLRGTARHSSAAASAPRRHRRAGLPLAACATPDARRGTPRGDLAPPKAGRTPERETAPGGSSEGRAPALRRQGAPRTRTHKT